jgi:uncharacterized protein YbbK (DUF523 family)
MILVSACLLGENVKYNGENNLCRILASHPARKKMLPVCPEVLGGLGVPREAAEIQGYYLDLYNNKAAVTTKSGKDVTKNFTDGARKGMIKALQHNVRAAILKDGSPSCGADTIYDGSFSGKKIEGQGAFASLLDEHGIPVYTEKDVTEELLTKLLGD